MTTKELHAKKKAERDAANAARFEALPRGRVDNIQHEHGVYVRFERGEEQMLIGVRSEPGGKWAESLIFIDANQDAAEFILAFAKRYNACVQRTNAMAVKVPPLETLQEIQVGDMTHKGSNQP